MNNEIQAIEMAITEDRGSALTVDADHAPSAGNCSNGTEPVTGSSGPEMEFDPVANIFPMIEGVEFDDLVEDIKRNGLLESIWTYRGKIIDGRNRYRACLKAGVHPTFKQWDGGGSLVEFVVSMNLHRRHLSASQRALLAAELTTLKKGQRADTQNCASVTVGQAAKAFNVSSRQVNDGRTVSKFGVRELIEQAKAGYLPVSKAARIAKEPHSLQKAYLAQRKCGTAKSERRKAFGNGGTVIKSASANTKQPNPKGMSDLEQHLMFAGRYAKNCGFRDVELTVKKARRQFEEHKARFSENNLANAGYNGSGLQKAVGL